MSVEIANTILEQLGGYRKVNGMVGIKQMVALPEDDKICGGLRLKLKTSGKNGINMVTIRLNGLDLYDVEYGRLWGTTYKIKNTSEGIYCDMLVRDVETTTALYLSL